ncbi:hypothetical protein Tcan_07167 [Toxocara canis]|uniref:Uncharacterized protein n=1 Tax=Toxocara canis TaxID=6265 RepID=A0A0B2V4I4_TOXCA|nr:hypothetical protein Tcan_07167 [Toxocara canis]
MLRLNFNWAENALRITTLNDQHTGHDLSADSYAKIASKIRRSSPTSATPERGPVIRRPQAQHPLRDQSSEGVTNVADLGPSRSPSVAATPPPSKTPLSLLAHNVAQVGSKQETTVSNTQSGYASNGSQPCGALQNLAAVAAAISHQQQMAAAALFAHHKENMSFGFPNAPMIPPTAASGPQILPLIRGMLGLPNFASPLLMPTLQSVSTGQESQLQVSITGTGTRSATAVVSAPVTISAATCAQQLRAQQMMVPHVAPAPLQPTVAQPAPFMSVHAAVPTSQASVPLAHAATPIDLSAPTSNASTSTGGDERMQEVSRVLQSFISLLVKSPNDDEYKRRLFYLKSLQKIWQAANLQPIRTATSESGLLNSPSAHLRMDSHSASPNIALQRNTHFDHGIYKMEIP